MKSFAFRPAFVYSPILGSVLLIGASWLAGCSGAGTTTSTTTTTPAGAVTPTVTVAPSATGTVTTAQSLTVTVTVSASSSTPAGTVVLSSGSYASFPATLASGQATFTVPASLLAPGSDALTAAFTPTSSTAFNSASGSATVSIAAASTALPVVTATPTNYPTSGSAFRALPLSNGNVMVSVTGANTGIQVFTPAGGGLLQPSCTLNLRSSFISDGASALGTALTPNGNGLALAIGVDGALFYDLPTLQTCNTTGFQVSQGSVSANEGTFDVAITPDGKYAFVANEYGVASGATNNGNVGVIALSYSNGGTNGDVTTGSTLLGQISTGGRAIAGITLSPDGTRLYVTSEIAGSATNVAGGSNPILTESNCVQVAGSTPQANGLLTVINVAAAEANPGPSAIISTVAAGCSPVRMVETSDESTLWVSARGDNRVLAFSTGMLEANPGNALLGYASTGGTAPVGLRLFHNQQLLAVTNSNRFTTNGSGTTNATILAIPTPTTATVVQTIPTGAFPREVAVGSDDATLYITNYGLPTVNAGASQFQVVTTTVH